MSGSNKVLVFDDDRLIALRRELQFHPELMKKLEVALDKGTKTQSIIFDLKEGDEIPVVRTFDEMIGFLAAQVGVLVHGTYSAEDMYGLCDEIRGRLEQRRTTIINSSVIIH